jgi:hypothetical protein
MILQPSYKNTSINRPSNPSTNDGFAIFRREINKNNTKHAIDQEVSYVYKKLVEESGAVGLDADDLNEDILNRLRSKFIININSYFSDDNQKNNRSIDNNYIKLEQAHIKYIDEQNNIRIFKLLIFLESPMYSNINCSSITLVEMAVLLNLGNLMRFLIDSINISTYMLSNTIIKKAYALLSIDNKNNGTDKVNTALHQVMEKCEFYQPTASAIKTIHMNRDDMCLNIIVQNKETHILIMMHGLDIKRKEVNEALSTRYKMCMSWVGSNNVEPYKKIAYDIQKWASKIDRKSNKLSI